MMRGISRLAGAAGLLLAGACATIPGSPPAAGPGAPSVALVARLAEAEAAIRTVRGLASVSYSGPGGSGSATQVIVVALPDRARLETLTPLGTAGVILTIRGDELRFHSLLSQEYGVGRATPALLGRLARVPVPPGPLLRLVAGLAPLPLDPGDPRLRITAEAGATRVDSVEGSLWQRLWVGKDADLLRGELGDAAGPLLQFRFTDRQVVDGQAFPQVISLEAKEAQGGVTLHFQTVRLNQPLPADLFLLPPPQDGKTKILRLDADRSPEGGQP